MANDNNEERGQMTVQEAGKMGGEKRKQELGPEGYSELGHMGGQRVSELVQQGKEAEGNGGGNGGEGGGNEQ